MVGLGVTELALIGGSCLCSFLFFAGVVAGIVFFIRKQQSEQ